LPCAVVALFAAVLAVRAQPATLALERRGNEIRLSTPNLHFIAGPPLERLRDGMSVTYVFSVEIVPKGTQGANNATFRLERRFVVSYDLWEESFEVVAAITPGVSASRLSAEMAEAWCLDNVRVPVASAPAETAFVLRLECFVEDEESQGGEASPGLTLTALIDRLSRRGREIPSRWEAASPTVRVRDIADRAGR